MPPIAEATVEQAALDWLSALGYAVLYGPDIAYGQPAAERTDPGYRDVILQARLRAALARLNPDLPAEALDDACRKLTRVDAPSLVEHNRAAHRLLTGGVNVEYRRRDGSIAGARAAVLDFDQPENNEWLAVHQFTMAEGQHTRRPDVVLFVNGLPLAVIELKNPADENATVESAFHQFQTYQAQVPALFTANEALVVSDGLAARVGALGAGWEWFKPWRTIEGRQDAPAHVPELEVALTGVFAPRRFLDLVRYFVVFEQARSVGGAGKITKKLADYHQFHAVNAAVAETLRASSSPGAAGVALGGPATKETPGRYEAGQQGGGEPGDRRIGVVWHTQGSGKSLTMAFYAGRIILHPAMQNPTVVVIADEAHRSQYDFIDGYAQHMRDALPHASFIGFTGTPIEQADANTRAVFGHYISIYDIQRAVADTG